MALANKVIYQNGAIREFEKPEVCEAIKVANANRWTVGLYPIEWDDREARLKKEHEKHANASDKMCMTLKEAKKILEKEFAVISLHKSTEPFEFDENKWFKHEKPSVLEAFRVLSKEGYYITISGNDYDMRKKRLEKEYEDNTKAPGSGGEQPNEGNPALAESASQFNNALLDEQGKKIEELTMENERLKDQVAVLYAYKEHNENFDRKQIKRLGKEITRLNKIIHKKNLKIEELGKESSRHLRGKMKMFGENFDLEQELKDKNAVLSDVAEELRLSKIREKNLTEVCQKYMKENEELKKELADKVVDKIDAQALKSAESAIAYKENVIADLTHKLKDKHKKYVWYKGAYDDAQQILNTIADYAAKHPDKKFSDPMVEEKHPTIDNPDEIDIEKAVKLVRKAMKEGRTVTIDYKD